MFDKLKVLIVEDEHMAREQMVKFLKTKFGTVYDAENAIEALEIYEKETPDIILSDISMPDINGLEFVRMVKSINPDVPVIFVTAHSDEEYIREANSLKADGYLLKPVDFSELDDILKKVVQKNIKNITEIDKNIKILSNMSENFLLIQQGDGRFFNDSVLRYLSFEREEFESKTETVKEKEDENAISFLDKNGASHIFTKHLKSDENSRLKVFELKREDA